MPEENEYEIEEGVSIQYLFITRKDDEAKVFIATVERNIATVEHIGNPDFTHTLIEPTDIPLNEQKEISAAVSKYLEKKEQTIKIEVKSGTVVDVRNLPEGCIGCKVIDRDAMEEEQ